MAEYGPEQIAAARAMIAGYYEIAEQGYLTEEEARRIVWAATEPETGWGAALDALEEAAALLHALRLEMGEAASLIPCAGPVSHRIRVLQADHGQRVERMEKRIRTLEAVAQFVAEDLAHNPTAQNARHTLLNVLKKPAEDAE